MANLKFIPALVRDLSDAEAEDAAITENLQREDVRPREEPYLVALLIVGGQENHDGVRVLGLYQFAQLKTISIRQVDVQQHQIKFPLADGVGCGSGI